MSLFRSYSEVIGEDYSGSTSKYRDTGDTIIPNTLLHTRQNGHDRFLEGRNHQILSNGKIDDFSSY